MENPRDKPSHLTQFVSRSTIQSPKTRVLGVRNDFRHGWCGDRALRTFWSGKWPSFTMKIIMKITSNPQKFIPFITICNHLIFITMKTTWWIGDHGTLGYPSLRLFFFFRSHDFYGPHQSLQVWYGPWWSHEGGENVPKISWISLIILGKYGDLMVI